MAAAVGLINKKNQPKKENDEQLDNDDDENFNKKCEF